MILKKVFLKKKPAEILSLLFLGNKRWIKYWPKPVLFEQTLLISSGQI